MLLCAGGCGGTVRRTAGSQERPTCRACRRLRLADAPLCSVCGGPMGHNWRYMWRRGDPVQLPAVCGGCRVAAASPVPLTWLSPGR